MNGVSPLAALVINQVPAGTVIEHGGDRATVTEQSAVFRGREVFMTPANYSALKNHEKVTQL